MDGRREVDVANDASLDRQIQSLMTAEPSPEFLARVRARVAQEPEPGGWRASWLVAVAGATALVIVVVMTWPSSERVMEQPKVVQQAQGQGPTVAVPIDTREPVLAAPLENRAPRAPRPVAVGAADRAIEIDLPPVVIGENEVRAYASLVASLRESRFNAAVPAAPDLSAPLDVKELSPVEPLEIEPIVRLAAVQTEGERP